MKKLIYGNNINQMIQKPIDFGRRDFLGKASLLLASIGVAPMIRLEVLEKLSKKFGPPMAHAQSTSGKLRMIEFCLRAGVPSMMLGVPQAFAGTAVYPNVMDTATATKAAGSGANDILMQNQIRDMNGLLKANPLRAHAANIAVTQACSANGLPHSNVLGAREGGKGMGYINPIIELANQNLAGSDVIGVNWFRGNNVMNQTNGKLDLVDVADANAFLNLYRKPVLSLNDTEVSAVADAVSKIGGAQAKRLDDTLKGAEAVKTNQDRALQLMLTDLSAQMGIASMDPNFRTTQNRIFNRTWGFGGQALAYTLKAFELGALSAATITLNTGDWHGDQQIGSEANIFNTHQGHGAGFLADILSAAISFMKATPDPATGGAKTLWDTTLIVFNSEFNRAVNRMGVDNADGGTNGMIMIGSNVVGGYYGSFNTSGTGGASIIGFDPNTGAPQSAMGANQTEGLYNTVAKALGLNSLVKSGKQTFNCMIG